MINDYIGSYEVLKIRPASRVTHDGIFMSPSVTILMSHEPRLHNRVQWAWEYNPLPIGKKISDKILGRETGDGFNGILSVFLFMIS